MKISEWLELWLNKSVKYQVKIKTYNQYASAIKKHLIPTFGDIEISELNYENIIYFVNNLGYSSTDIMQKSLSSNSINSLITILKLSLDEAVKFGHIKINCCKDVKKIKTYEKKVEAFSIAEQKKIEKFIFNSRKEYNIGVLVGLYTGIRLGEMLALKWSDVDLENGLIHITKTITQIRNYDGKYGTVVQAPKTQSSNRIIPLPKFLIKKFKVMKKSTKTDYLIQNKGRTLTIRGYQYLFEKILKRLNIEKKGFHALRHTFATRAIECGFDVKTLSEIMGHSSVAITLNRYTHSLLSQKKIMMQKLDKII